MLVFNSGCGVNSDSSSRTSTSTMDPDSNTTDPDSNTTDPDSNTTDPDSNTTDPDSNTTEPDPVTESIYDEYACGHVDYKAIVDNSLYPAATTSAVFGLTLTSYYPKSFVASGSEVILFHPLVFDGPLDNLADVLVITDQYSFSFDRNWIGNGNSTIYIMSPKDYDDNFECYRYELNSTNTSDIKNQMVLVHRDY